MQNETKPRTYGISDKADAQIKLMAGRESRKKGNFLTFYFENLADEEDKNVSK